MTPLASVGMPIYNAEPWLRETIDSLLAQTFAEFELVISDNASTDQSAQIVESYAARDSRIRFIRHPVNVGANGNYDAVLRMARGSYFKWASCNDICAPQFLEKCVAALERDRSAVLAYPRTVTFTTDPASGQLYDQDFELLQDDSVDRFKALFGRMYLNNAMNGVFRREPLARALRMGSFRAADILLMAEVALSGKFLLLEEPLFYRRMSPEAATSRRSVQDADRHLAPAARRPLSWQQWRYFSRLMRVSMRAQPGLRARGRAGAFGLRYAVMFRERLWADFLGSIKTN